MHAKSNPPLTRLARWWEKKPAVAWTLSILWVLLLCGLAFFWHLGSVGLLDETEPLFVEASRQMTLTGDWITPYFNGETRFDKPPLIYWLMAIAFQIGGVNEWTARLPSALAATGLAGLGFYTLRRFGFPRPGEASHLALWLSAWIGAALMALNPQTIGWGRQGVSDMLLTGCMDAGLLAFFLGYAQPGRPRAQTGWYLVFYVLTGLAVLAKGPVGCVLPALIVACFLGYTGQFRAVLREMHLLPGIALFLAISVPWYVLVILANGQDYIDAFFGYHNVERFTQVVNGHDGPWYFYFMVVLIGFAPWSVYLPAAIARLRFWRVREWRAQPRSAHLGIYALIWFAGIFGFFTIAVTKLPSYVLPLMPAAAIIVGLFWSDHLSRPRRSHALLWSGIANLLFFLLLIGAALYSPNWMEGDPSMPNLPDVVRQSNIMVWGAVLWGGVAIAGLILMLKQQTRWLWAVNLLGMGLFIVAIAMPAFFIVDAQRQLPLRQLADAIVTHQRPGEEVIMVGFKKPSLVFYTRRSITYLKHPEDVVDYLRDDREAPATVDTLLLSGRLDKIREVNLPADQLQPIEEPEPYSLTRIDLSQLDLSSAR